LEGEKKGNSQMRGYFVSALCLFFVGYVIEIEVYA